MAHRKRIDAKLAIFDDHWAGYEAALRQMNEAVREYRLALDLLLEKRLTHVEPVER